RWATRVKFATAAAASAKSIWPSSRTSQPSNRSSVWEHRWRSITSRKTTCDVGTPPMLQQDDDAPLRIPECSIVVLVGRTVIPRCRHVPAGLRSLNLPDTLFPDECVTTGRDPVQTFAKGDQSC